MSQIIPIGLQFQIRFEMEGKFILSAIDIKTTLQRQTLRVHHSTQKLFKHAQKRKECSVMRGTLHSCI